MKNLPTYYSILPADVRYNKELTAGAKILFSEIAAMASKNQVCWASNQFFAELYNVRETAITNWVKSLKLAGLITTEYEYKPGTKTIARRLIRLVKPLNIPKKKDTHKNATPPTTDDDGGTHISDEGTHKNEVGTHIYDEGTHISEGGTHKIGEIILNSNNKLNSKLEQGEIQKFGAPSPTPSPVASATVVAPNEKELEQLVPSPTRPSKSPLNDFIEKIAQQEVKDSHQLIQAFITQINDQVLTDFNGKDFNPKIELLETLTTDYDTQLMIINRCRAVEAQKKESKKKENPVTVQPKVVQGSTDQVKSSYGYGTTADYDVYNALPFKE